MIVSGTIAAKSAAPRAGQMPYAHHIFTLDLTDLQVHSGTLTEPFYLGQHEVTVEQFRRFAEATGYRTDAEKGTGLQGAFGWNSDTMQFTMNEQYSWRNTGVRISRPMGTRNWSGVGRLAPARSCQLSLTNTY